MKGQWKRLAAGFLVLTMFVTSSHIEAFATEDKNDLLQPMEEEIEVLTEELESEAEEESVSDSASNKTRSASSDEAIPMEGSCGESATYTLIDGVLTISGTGAVNASAFAENDAIISVVIGDEITTIGRFAFDKCKNLTSVELGEGVITVDLGAFEYCHSMRSLTIKSNLTGFHKNSFADTGDNITLLTVGEKVTEIPERIYGFEGLEEIVVAEENESYCSEDGILYNKEKSILIKHPLNKQTKQLVIPETVTEIAKNAVENIDTLEEVIFPANLEIIGNYAFADCDGLVEIVIPDKVTTIGRFAFDKCENLTNVVLGEGVITVDYGAFEYCHNMRSLTIKSNLTGFHNNSFAYTGDNIILLTVGEKVTEIPERIYGFEALEEIAVAEENENYCSEDGSLYNKEKTQLIKYPQSKEGESCIVPDTVQKISEYAFDANENLKSIVLGKAVTEIGQNALAQLDALVQLEINSDITTLTNNTFGNTSWEKLEIGESVTQINEVFYSSANLEEINVNENNRTYSSHEGVLYNKDQSQLIKYPPKKSEESYNIRPRTEVIAEEAFADNNSLVRVVVPDGLKIIGKSAFKNCKNLISVSLPDGAAEIGESAFENCTALTAVTIPDSVEAIGNSAFKKAETVTIYCSYDSVAAKYAVANDIQYATSTSCITFSLEKQYAVVSGAEEQKYSDSIRNYDVAITNDTRGTELSGYRISSGSIVLDAATIAAGDRLTIRLVSKTGNAIDYEQTFELDEKCNASINMVTLQKGYISTEIETKVDGTMLVYDEDGNLLEFYGVKNSDIKKSSYLDAGNYQLIFIQGSTNLWDLEKISEFDELELTKNKDYIYKTVTVEDGVISDQGKVRLFDLDTEKLMYLDTEECNYYTNITATQKGSLISVKMTYSIKEARRDELNEEKSLSFRISDKCEYVEGSMKVNGVEADVEQDSWYHTVTANTTDDEGVVQFTLRPSGNGTITSTAQILFKAEGKTHREKIGEIKFEVPYISLYCNGTTSSKDILVSGRAVPGTTVYIYDNFTQIGTAVSNKSAHWCTSVTLNKARNKSTHSIWAKMYMETGETIKTEGTDVYYATTVPEVEYFTMFTENAGIIDLLQYQKDVQNGKRRHIWTMPSYNMGFSLRITNSDRLEKVYIVSKKWDGEQLLEARNMGGDTWRAYGSFGTHTVPGNISVKYEEKYIPIDIESGEHLMTEEEYKALPDDILNAQVEVKENSYDEEGYGTFEGTIAFGESDDTAVECKVETKKLKIADTSKARGIAGDVTIAPKNPGQLEREGFERLEGYDSDYAYYIKFEETKDGRIKQQIYKYPTDNGNVIGDTAEYAVTEIAAENVENFTEEMNPLDPVLNIIETATDVDGNNKKIEYVRNVIENADISEGERAVKLGRLEKIEEMKNYYNFERICLGVFAAVLATTTGPLGFGLGLITGALGTLVNSQIQKMIDQLLLMLLDLEMSWIIDPSGYVYEAVPSNRLEGVTATIYYKDKDGNEVLWDASEYEQENPLITDSDGRYAWDVPEGEWKVKYELDGYENGESEWLPVPPVQLDVNEGMISLTAPEVDIVELYEEYAVITFDKYMKVSSMLGQGVLQIVDANGNVIDATMETPDEEKSPEGIALARSYRLVFDDVLKDGQYAVKVSKDAESYAGVKINDAYETDLEVKKAIKDISIEVPKQIVIDQEVVIPVKIDVPDKQDYKITATSSMNEIAEVVSVSDIDENGFVYVTVKANLPGKITLNVSVDGTTIREEAALEIRLTAEDEIPVEKTEIHAVYIEDIPNQTYTGKSLTPSVELTDNGKILVEGTDYTLSYANNDAVGTATVTITGCGNYQGTVNVEFEILPCSHNWDKGTVIQKASCEKAGQIKYSCTMCGEERTETVKASGHKWNGGVITTKATCEKAGVKKYTCTNCSATKTETIKAAGHKYKVTKVNKKATTKKNGKLTKQCTVCKKSVTETLYRAKTVSLSKTSFTYNGKTQKPKVTVKDSKGKVISSSNYKVSYSKGCKKVGTYKVTVKFKGQYSGTLKKSFKIKKGKQVITASNFTKKVGDKAFSIKAKRSSGGGKLTYKSSNKKIATVSSKGKVTIKKAGKVTITITAASNKNYSKATKKITVTVKPK